MSEVELNRKKNRGKQGRLGPAGSNRDLSCLKSSLTGRRIEVRKGGLPPLVQIELILKKTNDPDFRKRGQAALPHLYSSS
jgi:hypothetical protein